MSAQSETKTIGKELHFLMNCPKWQIQTNLFLQALHGNFCLLGCPYSPYD